MIYKIWQNLAQRAKGKGVQINYHNKQHEQNEQNEQPLQERFVSLWPTARIRPLCRCTRTHPTATSPRCRQGKSGKCTRRDTKSIQWFKKCPPWNRPSENTQMSRNLSTSNKENPWFWRQRRPTVLPPLLLPGPVSCNAHRWARRNSTSSRSRWVHISSSCLFFMFFVVFHVSASFGATVPRN